MKTFLFVLFATVLESAGDAVLRIALQSSAGARLGLFAVGAVLLTAYGTSLNLAPVAFASVVGLYVALLFIMFQVMNFAFFRVAPTLPVYLGGVLIFAGGMIVYFGTRNLPASH